MRNRFAALVLVSLCLGWVSIVKANGQASDTMTENGVDLLPVFAQDSTAWHVEVAFYVAVPKTASVLSKLEQIADRLSRFLFQYTGIGVIRIDTLDGRAIAHISLACDSMGRPWAGKYFEGSSRGHTTMLTLWKSFVQDDYHGEWIDGVKFYLGEMPVTDTWDHVHLAGVLYRSGSAPPGYRDPFSE